MSQILLLTLLFISMLLLVVEVLFIPGTTWFGVSGFVLGVLAIYFIFRELGSTAGYVTGSVFGLVLAILLYYGFSAKTWDRFALHNTLTTRVNDESRPIFEPGQLGITVSSLKPSGKAAFSGNYTEVQTQGGFVDAGVAVVILKVENAKVIVAPA